MGARRKICAVHRGVPIWRSAMVRYSARTGSLFVCHKNEEGKTIEKRFIFNRCGAGSLSARLKACAYIDNLLKSPSNE